MDGAVSAIGTNNSLGLSPAPESGAGFVHQLQLQCTGTMSQDNKNCHSHLLPLTIGNSRVEESSTPPESLLCVGLRPTYISSQNISTLHTSSASFPIREMTFNVSRASLCNRDSDRQGPCLRLHPTHTPPDPFGPCCKWGAVGASRPRRHAPPSSLASKKRH